MGYTPRADAVTAQNVHHVSRLWPTAQVGLMAAVGPVEGYVDGFLGPTTAVGLVWATPCATN
jgi:hypothetical protein